MLGDPHQLAQVLRNLVDNAACHAEAEVALGLRQRGGCAEVEVIDDGPGIPAADRDRVFARFVRLDESRERARGGSGLGLAIAHEIVSGLGLAIAHEIVTAHGGSIEVAQSRTGACLLLTLPLQRRPC